MLFSEIISVAIFISIFALFYIFEFKLIFYDLVFLFTRKKRPPVYSVRLKFFVHGAAILGVVCFLYGYFIEPYWIEVKHVEIKTDKLKNTELVIAQISDVHCDEVIRNEYKVVKILNDIKPDIVVFTGDTLNSARAITLFKDFMGKIEAPLGKFAVEGNFENRFWGNLDLFSGTGFKLLKNQEVSFSKNGEVVTISGLAQIRPLSYLPQLSLIPEKRLHILLFHSPDLIKDVAFLPIDLYLCGHTHGGQVALPGYGAVITFAKYGKKFEKGLYKVGGVTLYVNRGIGMEGGFIAPRIRFLSRPEITVFTIKPRKK